VRSIGADHQVKADLNLFVAHITSGGALNLNPGLSLSKVCTGQLVMEENLDVFEIIECVQELFI
jgi:hypothetical protein